MTTHLSHAHRTTYEAICRHPVAHNLQWRDVRSMLGVLAEVVEEAGGALRVNRNGQTLVLHPDRHKDVGTEEQLKDLRGFLERSEQTPAPPVADGVHLLVVINHRLARVYRAELRGSVPERIVPHDPENAGRHLHYVQDDSNGQRRPENKSYYEAVARTLHGAEGVLVFGSGTGASSAMERLLDELRAHHKDLAARIVGSVVVDEHHLTEDQLLAKARECYAQIAAGRPPMSRVEPG